MIPPVSTSVARPTTSAISSDFTTFITLLTAQIRNQDPMNPMDSTDFATQLATFSGVEQQVLSNNYLKQLVEGGGATGALAGAHWVGMQARTSSDLAYTGQEITLHTPLLTGAVSRDLVLRDPSGQEVTRLSLPLSSTDYVLSDSVISLPYGRYRAEVEQQNAQGQIDTQKAEHYATIREVQRGADGAEYLLLEGGATLLSSSVTALRPAP